MLGPGAGPTPEQSFPQILLSAARLAEEVEQHCLLQGHMRLWVAVSDALSLSKHLVWSPALTKAAVHRHVQHCHQLVLVSFLYQQ